MPAVLEGRTVIFSDADATRMSLDALVGRLQDVDVVFVGEVHDDSLTHILEYALLEALYDKDAALAVSLEMFERDVQQTLDDYLGGRISEETFLSLARPWGNYKAAYRPLVEFARSHGLPVLAMNVPRRYAGRVAMMGEAGLSGLSDSERLWSANELKALDNGYKERFMDLMGGDRPAPMARMDPENLYKAQCLKDDTMAESIHLFRRTHPGVRVISYQGDFHSAYGLGIVKKLTLLDPAVRVAVLTVIPADRVDEPDVASHRAQGEYLIFVERIAGSR
jgi:uncharacterized iron-regulated protein